MSQASRAIREARVASNLTQAELARKAGWPQSNVARYERDDYEGHKIQMLEHLAKAMGKKIVITVVDKRKINEQSSDEPDGDILE